MYSKWVATLAASTVDAASHVLLRGWIRRKHTHKSGIEPALFGGWPPSLPFPVVYPVVGFACRRRACAGWKLRVACALILVLAVALENAAIVALLAQGAARLAGKVFCGAERTALFWG